MQTTHHHHYGSVEIVNAYIEHLVPRIFDPIALVLLEAARFSRGEHMLDVACGPGTAARMAADMVGPFGRVTATDISEEMLAVAQNSPKNKNTPPVEFIMSGSEALPFGDDEFDVVICQQGLQFFTDRARALAEMRRVLKPHGRIAVACWAEIQQCPYFNAIYQALAETAGPDATHAIQVPFSFPYPNALTFELKSAGFCDIHVETVSRPLVFEHGIEAAISAIDGTPIKPILEKLPAEKQQAFHDAAKRLLKPLVWDDRVETIMVSNIAVGHAPDN